MIYVLAFHGLSLTGFAAYGANAFCGADVSDGSALTVDFSGLTACDFGVSGYNDNGATLIIWISE